ncbi:MAG: phosphotransferase [Lachnospiraceae bacterium]|nr:phosphotransferase [Lachnospiraceae bacterium]
MDMINDFPESIRNLTEGKPFETNDFGKSGSLVRIYEDFVLKVEKERPQIARMVEVMRWLEGKLPVPKILATEVKDGYRYLLMSKVQGRMACDEYYMNRSEELTTLLAEALRMLWSIDISDCPKTFDLSAELEEAKYRVEHNLVDLDDIALGYRSLRHNADGTYGKFYEGVNPDELFVKLGIEPDWEKIRYYILLDELF